MLEVFLYVTRPGLSYVRPSFILCRFPSAGSFFFSHVCSNFYWVRPFSLPTTRAVFQRRCVCVFPYILFSLPPFAWFVRENLLFVYFCHITVALFVLGIVLSSPFVEVLFPTYHVFTLSPWGAAFYIPRLTFATPLRHQPLFSHRC